MECRGGALVERIERLLRNRAWGRWLEETMRAFTAALAGVAERRATDAVAALFLAEVGSSAYAAARVTGRSPEEALREAMNLICTVYEAAKVMLEEGFRSGRLEEAYREALKRLGGGEALGG